MMENKREDFNRLLIGYRYFVENVENGYTLCISEYINDLNTRDLLEEYREEGKAISDEDNKTIADLDVRLQRVLKATLRPVWSIEPIRWWHRGLPSNAGDELRNDATRLGYWEKD